MEQRPPLTPPPFPNNPTLPEVFEWWLLMRTIGAAIRYPDDGWTHPGIDVSGVSADMRASMSDPEIRGFIYGLTFGDRGRR